MSKRLAGLVRKVARRSSRGLETPAHPVVDRPFVSGNPWAGIPDSERETTIEIRDGILITTFVDTPESRLKRRPLPPPPVPDDEPQEGTNEDLEEPAAAPPPDTSKSDWERLEEADNRHEPDGN